MSSALNLVHLKCSTFDLAKFPESPLHPFTSSPLHHDSAAIFHSTSDLYRAVTQLASNGLRLGDYTTLHPSLLAYRKAANCCNKSKMSCHALHEQRYIRLDHAQPSAQRSEKATCGSDIKVQERSHLLRLQTHAGKAISLPRIFH